MTSEVTSAGVLPTAKASASSSRSADPVSMASASPSQATPVTVASPPNRSIRSRWYALAVVAGVAQIATAPPPALAGLIAGTVPTTGTAGSYSARSRASATTDAVLQASTMTSGEYGSVARADVSTRSVMSSGGRGPHGTPEGLIERTRSVSGLAAASAAEVAKSPSPESMRAMRIGHLYCQTEDGRLSGPSRGDLAYGVW